MLKVVITLERKDGLSHEEFLQYWREVHAPLAEQLPHLQKYTMSEPVDADADVDGIAQLYYDSMEEFQASMDSDVADQVREDSANYTNTDAGAQYLVREDVRLDTS